LTTSLDVTPEQRAKVEPLSEEDRRAAPVDSVDEALSAADFQSIPPTGDVEPMFPPPDVESMPPSVESVPPSANSRLTAPGPSSAGVSVDVSSVVSATPATARSAIEPDPVPFTPALAPPLVSDPRAEEPTSAPVVRPLAGEGGVDLASTLMSSGSGRAANKKIVIGAVAAAGVLAIIGLIRAATSGSSAGPAPLSASAATTVAQPAPPAVEQPAPSGAVEPAASAETAEQAPSEVSPPPTSAPALSPVDVPQQPGQKRQAPPTLQQQPMKKKPYRPSGI
jgi:hypothetical protein